MSRAVEWVTARVQCSDFTHGACPACDEPGAASADWVALAETGTMVIGHTLACERCRPEGVFSCEGCAGLLPLDGKTIHAHVVRCFSDG